MILFIFSKFKVRYISFPIKWWNFSYMKISILIYLDYNLFRFSKYILYFVVALISSSKIYWDVSNYSTNALYLLQNMITNIITHFMKEYQKICNFFLLILSLAICDLKIDYTTITFLFILLIFLMIIIVTQPPKIVELYIFM